MEIGEDTRVEGYNALLQTICIFFTETCKDL
jgi:hypothetical protein